MIEILQTINKISDVNGCLIAENNGIVIMSDLSSDVNEQTLAAETSSKLNEIKKTLSLFKVGKLKRCILTGNQGSYLFSNIGNAFLVILIRKNANIGYVQIEAERHLDELREKMKL